MTDAIADPVVVITGSTRGIGRAAARAFARRGARIVAVGRSTSDAPNRVLPGTLEEVEAELTDIGAAVLAVQANVADQGDVERIAQATLERFGRCDVLVNNAAVSFVGGFLDIAPSKWRTVFGVNLLGPVMLTHALLPPMLDRGSGHVINVGSGAAFSDRVPQLPYSITKLGLERLTTGLASQFGGRGIGFSCMRIDEVVPTEAVSYSAPHLEHTARSTPDAIANAIVWMSDQLPEPAGRIFTLDELRELGALV